MQEAGDIWTYLSISVLSHISSNRLVTKVVTCTQPQCSLITI